MMAEAHAHLENQLRRGTARLAADLFDGLGKLATSARIGDIQWLSDSICTQRVFRMTATELAAPKAPAERPPSRTMRLVKHIRRVTRATLVRHRAAG